jgi:predicted DNA-binding protein
VPRVDTQRPNPYVKGMEVQLRPELEEKLNELSSRTGRPAGELVEDAITGYLDDLAGTREMLDSRYDEIKSGKVKLIPGEEVFAKLRAKSEARKSKPGQ